MLHPKTFEIKSQSLPLAALVTNGASSSIGLLVVSGHRITFWHDIDTALSFQNSVDCTLSLFSGETPTDLANADHAGFIITLSSGRIVHLGLRDPQGKPALTTQFLRSNDSGGLFGSIKGLLGGRREVVRVRTRRQGSRGQIEVISVTATGQVQIWDLTWLGHITFRDSYDLDLRVHDFAVLGHKLLLLVNDPDGPDGCALVEVGDVQRRIPVKGRGTQLSVANGIAYVMSDKTVAIVSLLPDDGPDAQLLAETQQSQDLLRFKNCIINAGQLDDPSLLLIKNFGLARLTVECGRITSQDKLEQAVCFGTRPNNIVDFDVEPDVEAAVEVSHRVINSQAPVVTAVNVLDSIDVRARAIDALIKYVGPVDAIKVDREKLAAARALWKSHESHASEPGYKPSVLPAIIHVDLARHKAAPEDTLRSWFTSHVDRIDTLCDTAMELVANSQSSGEVQHLMKMLSETNDLIFAVYGHKDYTPQEEPWTSRYNTLLHLESFIALSRNYTVEFYENPGSGDNSYVVKVINENVRLVKILFEAYRERLAWSAGSKYAPGLEEKFRRSREHHLQGLVKIGQAGAGLSIAEEFQDMESLVRLVVSETAYLVESFDEPGLDESEREVITVRMDELQANVQRYFETFGDAWATAYFDSHLASHRCYGLFKSKTFQAPLTRYLRTDKRGRLGWINEVLNEKDLGRAQAALTTLATGQEVRLWNKKVELALARLAGSTDSAELQVIQVQEQLLAHVQGALFGAVDKAAELQLLTDAYAISMRKTLPALQQLLELAFDDLINHKVLTAEQLVDVLTLMDSVPSGDDDLSSQEFHLALKVLRAVTGRMQQDRLDVATRLVWKRLLLADDWDTITATKGKTEVDVQTDLRDSTTCQTIYLGLKDGMYSRFLTVAEEGFLMSLGTNANARNLNPAGRLARRRR